MMMMMMMFQNYGKNDECFKKSKVFNHKFIFANFKTVLPQHIMKTAKKSSNLFKLYCLKCRFICWEISQGSRTVSKYNTLLYFVAPMSPPLLPYDQTGTCNLQFS